MQRTVQLYRSGIFFRIAHSALIIGRYWLGRTFTKASQIRRDLHLPLVCSIPILETTQRSIRGKVLPIPEVSLVSPDSSVGVAIRKICNAVQFNNGEKLSNVIQIVSVDPREGKTTVSLSLALKAASLGKKVLLIDADLRASTATRFLGFRNKPGLVDLLNQQGNPSNIAYYISDYKFWHIPTGNAPDDPSELFERGHLYNFVATIQHVFDFVIVDSPPLRYNNDAIAISKCVDTIFFIVRWGLTPRTDVRRMIQKLPIDRLAGVVLCFAPDYSQK